MAVEQIAMAYLYSFCFYFSLRLGTVVIGVLSLIQGFVKLTIATVCLTDPVSVSNMLGSFKDDYELSFMKPIFTAIILDPNKYAAILLTFSSFYIIYCLALIYGAYTFNTYMLYPYVFCEFLRLLGLFALHVVSMMIIKENVLNLGLLIGFSVFGGFVLLGMFYMWTCTLSLLQVIKELIREIEITDITNFPKKPAKLTDVYSIGTRRYYYNY